MKIKEEFIKLLGVECGKISCKNCFYSNEKEKVYVLDDTVKEVCIIDLLTDCLRTYTAQSPDMMYYR
jgi:hypothetical protein